MLRTAVADLHLARLAVCVPLALLGPVVPASKRVPVLAVAGLACIAIVSPDSLPGFALMACVTYALVHLIARVTDPAKRWRLALLSMTAVGLLFFFGRGYGLGDARVGFGGARVALFAVDMWALLRIVSILWEVGSGKIAPPRPDAFVAWVALPFTLVGPMVRPAQFIASFERPSARFALGAAWWKKVGIASAQILGTFALALLPTLGHMGPTGLRLLSGFLVGPWSFYLGTAAMFSLMEALAAFWQLDVPPSFNAPFGRRNLADFWANWNMTATNLLRDYLFFARWGLPKANFYLNAMIVFVLVGAWHGSNAYWLIFGAYHGVGYCAYLWLKLHKVKPLPDASAPWRARR